MGLIGCGVDNSHSGVKVAGQVIPTTDYEVVLLYDGQAQYAHFVTEEMYNNHCTMRVTWIVTAT